MAIVTVPLLALATYVAYRYLKKRRRDGRDEINLRDAALALIALPPELSGKVMQELPGPVAEAIAQATTELAAPDSSSKKKALKRLSQALGPGLDPRQAEPGSLATAIIRLVVSS